MFGPAGATSSDSPMPEGHHDKAPSLSIQPTSVKAVDAGAVPTAPHVAPSPAQSQIKPPSTSPVDENTISGLTQAAVEAASNCPAHTAHGAPADGKIHPASNSPAKAMLRSPVEASARPSTNSPSAPRSSGNSPLAPTSQDTKQAVSKVKGRAKLSSAGLAQQQSNSPRIAAVKVDTLTLFCNVLCSLIVQQL